MLSVSDTKQQFHYSPEKPISLAARDLGVALSDGHIRRNGEPESEHLRRVSKGIESIVMANHFSEALIGSGWLHDGPENNDEIDVWNPYDPPDESVLDLENKVYLNLLFEAGNDTANTMNYFIYKMTRRKGEIYAVHMLKKFSFAPAEKKAHNLDVLSGIMKMVDRNDNNDLNEQPCAEPLLDKYRLLRSASRPEILDFYARSGVLDKFEQRGDFGWDEKFFVDAFENSFTEMKRGNARDNLTFYIPIAETYILVPYYNKAQNLFRYNAFRELLKGMLIDSIRILKDPGIINELKSSGFYKGNDKLRGYPSLLYEVKHELSASSH